MHRWSTWESQHVKLFRAVGGLIFAAIMLALVNVTLWWIVPR